MRVFHQTIGIRLLASACLMYALAHVFTSTAWAQTDNVGTHWQNHIHAEEREGQAYLQLGVEQLLRALIEPPLAINAPPAWLILDRALRELDQAQRILPEDVNLAFLRAHALTRWERPGRAGITHRRIAEAISAWERVRTLSPDFHADRVAFELAGLHSRQRDHNAARTEYRRVLAHFIPPAVPTRQTSRSTAATQLAYLYAPVNAPTLYGNFAESCMLTGALDDAVNFYRRSLDAADDAPMSYALSLWGLALALDRRGEHREALAQATRAIQADPIPPNHPRYRLLHRRYGSMAILHFSGVFFEPPEEIYAYEALGHMALGETTSGEAQTRARRRALQSWRRFIQQGGRASRFAAQAREHIARLERELPEEEREESSENRSEGLLLEF